MPEQDPKASNILPPKETAPPSLDERPTLGQEGIDRTRNSINPALHGDDLTAAIGSVVSLGKIGPYELLEKLGEGGMGEVYKARHPKLKKIVALKVLPASAMRQRESIARFEREMEAVGKLDHPGIIRALDAGEHDGISYLVMEYVDGQDLHRLLKERGRLPIAEACGLIRQAAIALTHAHENNLVHRDIKPSNMLLTRQGQLKILDLGLARLGEGESANELTNTGISLGTPDFMSPEQWADTHLVDGRCDLYALGCTLFALLVGHPPFADGQHQSVVSKMTAHVHEEIPSLRNLRPETPVALDALCHQLLAKRAENRLASAAELVERISPFCNSADLPATSAFVVTPSASLTATTTRPVLPRRSRAIALGVALATGLVVLVMLWWNSFTPKRTAAPNSPSASTAAKTIQTGWQGWPADAPPLAITPFNAEQAKQHQEAWREYLKLPKDAKSSTGIPLQLIPPGKFLMGAEPDMLPDEPLLRPQREVELTEAFWISACEITQAEYQAVMHRNPAFYRSNPDIAPRLPVDSVTWFDAVEFCNTLSKPERHSAAYRLSEIKRDEKGSIFHANVAEIPGASGYRLPTEAQWEYAYRAGVQYRFYFGEGSKENAIKHARLAETGEPFGPIPVGSLLPNAWGLYDMEGNLSEWCAEVFDPEYVSKLKSTDPHGSILGEKHTVRGGSWGWWLVHVGAAQRKPAYLKPATDKQGIGFRIVRPLPRK